MEENTAHTTDRFNLHDSFIHDSDQDSELEKGACGHDMAVSTTDTTVPHLTYLILVLLLFQFQTVRNGYRGRNTSSRGIKSRNCELLATYQATTTALKCSREKELGMLIRSKIQISSRLTFLEGSPVEVND